MVTYDPIPGRIYDITCIVTALCDYEGYASFYESRVDGRGLHGITLEVYEFIRKYNITIEDDICFLFRYNCGNTRFISDYLRKSGAFSIFDSVNSFITWIRNLGQNLFLPDFCEYLEHFEGEKELDHLRLNMDSTSGEIFSYVSVLELEPRWKLSALSVFLDTSALVSKLADVLIRCEALLKDINVHFQDYIRPIENRKYDVGDLKRIWGKTLPTTDLINLENSVYSFSFLNDSMFFYLDRYNPVLLILGCFAEEYSIKNVLPDRVDIVLIGKAVGDANRFQILKLLEDRPMYATELATKLHIAHTSLFYHVNLLCEAGLICVSVQGRKTYYSINDEQFGQVSRYVADYYSKLLRRK